ncbi:glycosyltransferase [Nocardioides litoris]|uniref:glycosyltransferase n=1 Tax=Nocardioides litoris TaxID=1926648 RepID=UPI0011232402|nr:glycosyltransferase [Nocardioides litoris]
MSELPGLPGLPPPVRRFLDQGAGLLLAPDSPPGEHERVAVVGEPRRSSWPGGVRAAVVGLHGTVRAVTLVPRPEWPALVGVRSRRAGGGWWAVLRFAAPVDVAEVVAEVARQEVWGDRWTVSPAPAGAVDERVLNPTGFVPTAAGPVVDVADLPEVTAAVVAGLRDAAAVRVARWDDAATRAVPALALAGVPVVAEAAEVAEAAPDELGAPLRDAIAAPLDVGDAVAREEHSVLLRRAAFDHHSAWAARGTRHPAVSVLLATRRPEMLDFALRQVARQRGVDRLELVLAPHGFEVDEARVRDALPASTALQVVARPRTTLFGDVLQAAAEAAGGEVLLKMDDDDWYAPDVVTDLLRARAWSGAELVGMPAELHYLAERDLTAKRGHAVETYATFVAGGTMLVDRVALREVGGFRAVRRWVDAQLLDALRQAGAATYRTHGLGYVLRRNPTGHTWEADLDHLLDPSRTVATWEGFRPSRLLEADPRDAPTAG